MRISFFSNCSCPLSFLIQVMAILSKISNNEGKTHSYALSDWQLFHCIIILFCIYGEGINIQCLACDLETKENGEILYGAHMNWELFSY